MTREDFQWTAREIVQDGGEATVCDATFVEGLQSDHGGALFRGLRAKGSRPPRHRGDRPRQGREG
jgi:hypothetical protein